MSEKIKIKQQQTLCFWLSHSFKTPKGSAYHSCHWLKLKSGSQRKRRIFQNGRWLKVPLCRRCYITDGKTCLALNFLPWRLQRQDKIKMYWRVNIWRHLENRKGPSLSPALFSSGFWTFPVSCLVISSHWKACDVPSLVRHFSFLLVFDSTSILRPLLFAEEQE